MTEMHEMQGVIANHNATNTDFETNKGDISVVTIESGISNRHGQLTEEPSTNLLNKDLRHKIWQLVTFFRRVFIYFVVVGLRNSGQLFLPSWAELIFKCLPVFTLSIFIYRQFNSVSSLWKNKYAFLVFIGLTFSYIADGLLVYQNDHDAFFLSGLIAFAIAHVLYTFAFGWRPFRSRMMIRALISAGIVYYYLYSGNLQSSGIGLLIGVAVYMVIIMAMQWRAWARLSYRDITEARYYEISGALGASFFALSDAILGINKFRFSVPGEAYTILATYYVGQMLIAISVIDGPNIHWPRDNIERLDEIDGMIPESQNHNTARAKMSVKKVIHWIIS